MITPEERTKRRKKHASQLLTQALKERKKDMGTAWAMFGPEIRKALLLRDAAMIILGQMEDNAEWSRILLETACELTNE